VPAGLLSAVRVNGPWDNVGKILALMGLSIPGFWLGLVLILVFAVWLRWLPTSGAGDWRHFILPSIALGWYFAASLLRLTRSSMLEVLRSEYIKLARLKGLPEALVIAMHAFKNALIPVFTLVGVNLVVMVNAAVVIEVIFAWPGLPAGPGRGHHGRVHDHRRELAGGHPLCGHRPENSAHKIGDLWRAWRLRRRSAQLPRRMA
jgi:peptide/nickel transport system permease protein